MAEFYVVGDAKADKFVCMVALGDDLPEPNVRFWAADEAPASAAISLGFVLARNMTIEGFLAGCHEHGLKVSPPVELPFAQSKDGEYLDIVLKQLATLKPLLEAQQEARRLAEVDESELEAAFAVSLSGGLEKVCGILKTRSTRSWGEPDALETLLDMTQDGVQVAATKLNMSPDDTTRGEIDGACGELWQGVLALRAHGPESEQAKTLLNQGLVRLVSATEAVQRITPARQGRVLG